MDFLTCIHIHQTLKVKFWERKKSFDRWTSWYILATKEWRLIQSLYFNHLKRSDHRATVGAVSDVNLPVNKNVRTTALRTRIAKFTSRTERRVFKRWTIYLYFCWAVIEASRHGRARLNLIIGLIFPLKIRPIRKQNSLSCTTSYRVLFVCLFVLIIYHQYTSYIERIKYYATSSYVHLHSYLRTLNQQESSRWLHVFEFSSPIYRSFAYISYTNCLPRPLLV